MADMTEPGLINVLHQLTLTEYWPVIDHCNGSLNVLTRNRLIMGFSSYYLVTGWGRRRENELVKGE